MLWNLLLLNRLFRGPRRKPVIIQSYHPAIEPLEERIALDTFSWTGLSQESPNWTDRNNWKQLTRRSDRDYPSTVDDIAEFGEGLFTGKTGAFYEKPVVNSDISVGRIFIYSTYKGTIFLQASLTTLSSFEMGGGQIQGDNDLIKPAKLILRRTLTNEALSQSGWGGGTIGPKIDMGIEEGVRFSVWSTINFKKTDEEKKKYDPIVLRNSVLTVKSGAEMNIAGSVSGMTLEDAWIINKGTVQTRGSLTFTGDTKSWILNSQGAHWYVLNPQQGPQSLHSAERPWPFSMNYQATSQVCQWSP